MLIAFHKPYGVLSQFTEDVPGQKTLAAFDFPPRVYPLGRLDLDSEGLLLLSDEGALNARLLDPKRAHWRRYLAQVEGIATVDAMRQLNAGVFVQGRKTLPARCTLCSEEPSFPPRDPPVRFRKNIPTSWISVVLHEGRNRQVRRMTAAVGFPTLRLIRVRIGEFELPLDLSPGTWKELGAREREAVFSS